MRTILRFIASAAFVFVLPSCGPEPSDMQFVRQKIPVEIESGKPLAVEVRLSGNGDNEVGIRCSPQVWNVLTNGAQKIAIRLVSSTVRGTQIGGISPGSDGRWPIDSFHYLFYIYGEDHAKATVKIAFPYPSTETFRAEIIVCKTPADTGP